MKAFPQQKKYVDAVNIVTVVIFCFIIKFFLPNDFWQDEIYTLEHFVFVPWKTLFTDYHSTNNHVAYNAAVKLLVGVLGIHSIIDALEKPYLVRLIPFLFTLLGGIVFLIGMKKQFGRLASQIGISIFCTTIVFADFAVQMRGYSFSIFLTTLQIFIFLKVINRSNGYSTWFLLFLISGLNLFCLPTNIYITFSFLLLCFLLYIKPDVGTIFFNKKVSRKRVVAIALTFMASTLIAVLYYMWLLQMQPTNNLINTYSAFSWKNALQSLAIFYHFTDFRYYFFFIFFVWLLVYKQRIMSYTKVAFPFFCFFASFLFFFVHGAIIIQRTFISLLPFFVIMMAAVVEEVYQWSKIKNWILGFYLANILCLIFSFEVLKESSKKNNEISLHKHDLRNHYYLVNFNARKSVLKALSLSREKKVDLYVWDDFGETGILYYLKYYHVPFRRYTDKVELNKPILLLTNNKVKLEQRLSKEQILFSKQFEDQYQYNLYLLNTAD